MKKAKERSSKLKFSRIGPEEDLVILGIGDHSFKSEEKAVGGVLLFLSNSSMTKVVPIYWKSKTISRVCYSSKDTEMINMAKMMEDAIFAARQVEILIFGDYRKRIKVRLFTDSEATLESIALSKQIERKTLRLTVVDLKERLVDGDVYSYSWLQAKSMWADMMTKEMQLPSSLENVILENVLDLPHPLINKVRAVGMDIRMTNIRNR